MSDRWQPGVQAIASQRGEVVKILTDEFKSGKDTNRPAFRELLTELEIGHAEWDCVCVYKLSRITRSLRDGANIFEKFIQWNKGFVSVTEKKSRLLYSEWPCDVGHIAGI